MLCWHVCGVVPQDTHNLRKDTGVRGSDSDACCGQQQRLEQRGQQTNLVRLWSKGCGRVRCTHVHFYHRAVAMRSALMSTFITELWPCAVALTPFDPRRRRWLQAALLSDEAGPLPFLLPKTGWWVRPSDEASLAPAPCC